MSIYIKVQSAIRDASILKDTLKELGYDFIEDHGGIIEIEKKFGNIRINSDDGTISFDNVDTKEVNKIKQTYQLNFYRNQAIMEGMNLEITQEANGEIVLNLLH